MKKHILTGRYGHNDTSFVNKDENSICTILELLNGKNKLGYGIGHVLDDLVQIGIFPSEIGLDLLIVAIHVYCADTRINRYTEAQDGWTREIHLVVPVSDPDRWLAINPLLKRMLDFLTGDRWSFDFRPRPNDFLNLIPTHLPRLENKKYNKLSLFSGGLDSLIGAIDFLESGVTPLFISHACDGAVSHSQNECFGYLVKNYDTSHLERLRFWTHIPKGLIKGVESDPNQRSRSFLFFAIGVFAGTGLEDSFTLEAPENGLIAINVPLDPLRVGSLSTRTMHPFYLTRWNDLLKALEIPGIINNPYWNETKGEMVINCANPELLRKIIPFSLSCSAPSKGRYSKRGIENCGHCLPCLIRRAAIEKAYGLSTDPTEYTLKYLTERRLDTGLAEGQQVRSFQYIIERIHSQPNLVKLLIYKPGPLSDLSPLEILQLEGVYRRGMEEVGLLLNNVTT
jgi:hypothetical protein